jgi:hypothetical protein
MLPNEYGYLVASLSFLVPWFALFYVRPDERKEMLSISTFFGIASVVTAYLWWTNDWWLPSNVTGTRVGIEDYIVGFASGGIISAAYEVIWRKRHVRSSKKEIMYAPAWLLLLVVFLSVGALIWFTELTSFMASSIVMFVVGVYFHISRPDLLPESIRSGLVITVTSFAFFYLPLLIFFPGWIESTYLWPHLSGVAPLSIPIEEFIFWFLAGFFFGPWYEYWKHERLRAVPVARI